MRNPWLVILWIVAAFLAAAGLVALALARPASGETVVPVLVVPTVSAALAPWLLGAGVAAVAGAVLVVSRRVRR